MAFNTSGGDDDEIAPMAEINIIPLVDVMLVLLIISMVTAPFMEQGLNIDLPVTQEGKGLQKSTDNEQPVFLYISKDKGLMLGKDKLKKEELSSRLASLFSSRTKREIFVKADRSIPYGEVADVMSKVQAAGVAKVGLVTLPQ